MFTPSTFQERRKQLFSHIHSGIILLLGNEESAMNYTDNTYPFRQDSNFYYFTGINKVGMALVIDIDEGKETLFGAEVSIEHIVWMGNQPSMAEIAAGAGIAHIEDPANIETHVETAMAQGRTVHFLPPYRGENTLTLHHLLKIPANKVHKSASIELIKAVVALRSIKSDAEIAALDQAVNITSNMHICAMKMARPGLSEAQIAAAVHQEALAAHGDIAFPIILTVNGQILHNHYHGNTLQAGQLMLCDAGAQGPMLYSGDMTRTTPVNGVFSQQQKEIYEIVLAANLACIEDIAPGVMFRDIHMLAAKTITHGLQALGIMKGDPEASLAAGAHALFFPHGLGHMMGLDVHDMEDLGEDFVGYTQTLKRNPQFGIKSLRMGREVEKGFVLTVEPGIYFIPELINKWQETGMHKEFINYASLSAYHTFGGVRIEDDVVVTGQGCKVLGTPVPKTIADIEALKAG